MRLIVEFGKEGAAQYISHLDLMRVMQRALRRADLPVEYSQGFNPHAILSFATAVPVGCSSICEVADIHFARDVQPETFLSAMSAVLPEGMRVFRAVAAPENAPAPMAVVEAARYRILAQSDLRGAVHAFLGAETVSAMKKGKKGMREVNIRPMVYELAAGEEGGEWFADCLLRHDNAQALKPSLLMEALGVQATSILRTQLLIRKEQAWLPLYDAYERGNL